MYQKFNTIYILFPKTDYTSPIQVQSLTSTNLAFWSQVHQKQMRNVKNLSKLWGKAKCQNQGRPFLLFWITPLQVVMGQVKLEQAGVVHVSITQSKVLRNLK